MNQNPLRQQGITFGGLLFVLAFIAILVTFAVRAFPLYNEKMQIVSVMNSVASNPESAKASPRDIQRAFLRNLNATTNIQRFTERNVGEYVTVSKPEKRGDPRMLQVKFQATSPLFRDLNLMLDFDQQMPLRGGEGGE
jgi:Tfp pilus assembly protein FimT